jgi:broad specificity phosphatase PhoE
MGASREVFRALAGARLHGVWSSSLLEPVRMRAVYFITHPDVQIDPSVAVTEWPLSARGRDRMQVLLSKPWVHGIGAVWSSEERKAIEGAELLAAAVAVRPGRLAALGENDRSATGYLPAAEFEIVADAFFANPFQSVRGWECAVDAQHRIMGAIRTVITETAAGGDIAVVSHGAVGALLLCHLKRCCISRREDQPPTKGGNYFSFDISSFVLRHGWRPIDA